ncbi:MAG TPA: hypothetical protein G4N96_11160, partial [Chloroflexi bacterium]|nr:hypothetical protein [Chloroflexota bacterium]
TAALKDAYHREQDSKVKAHILYVAFNILSEAGDELLTDGLQSKDETVQKMAQQIQQDMADGVVARVYT